MRGTIATVAATVASVCAAAVFAGTAQAAVVSPAATSSITPAESMEGVWHGTYICGQGLTGMDLSITDEGGNDISATFEFSQVASNPVPRGAFTMTGEIVGPTVVLNSGHWVSDEWQPPNYSMVNLHGPLPSAQNPNRFDGTIDFAGCGEFHTTRDSASTVLPVPQ